MRKMAAGVSLPGLCLGFQVTWRSSSWRFTADRRVFGFAQFPGHVCSMGCDCSLSVHKKPQSPSSGRKCLSLLRRNDGRILSEELRQDLRRISASFFACHSTAGWFSHFPPNGRLSPCVSFLTKIPLFGRIMQKERNPLHRGTVDNVRFSLTRLCFVLHGK